MEPPTDYTGLLLQYVRERDRAAGFVPPVFPVQYFTRSTTEAPDAGRGGRRWKMPALEPAVKEWNLCLYHPAIEIKINL